jgi:hypothetical protein
VASGFAAEHILCWSRSCDLSCTTLQRREHDTLAFPCNPNHEERIPRRRHRPPSTLIAHYPRTPPCKLPATHGLLDTEREREGRERGSNLASAQLHGHTRARSLHQKRTPRAGGEGPRSPTPDAWRPSESGGIRDKIPTSRNLLQAQLHGDGVCSSARPC